MPARNLTGTIHKLSLTLPDKLYDNGAMTTFRTVMDQWPSIRRLAADVGAPPARAVKWYERDSIPPNVWRRLVNAAEANGYKGVTADLLTDIASTK